MPGDRSHQESERLLQAVSRFLMASPCAIAPEDVRALGVDEEEGYRLMLAAFLGLNLDDRADAALYHACFPQMVRRLDPSGFEADPYLREVGFRAGSEGSFTLGTDSCSPMELFVRDDMIRLEDGHVIPRLGWFARKYDFPALREGGRIWMTVTPNEVNTIRPLAEASRGRVLCLGLGLGYYAFHALRNPEVTGVTVVERDAGLIRLFDRVLRPFFPKKKPLTIVRGDAFDAVRRLDPGAFDTVFTDLWHDAGDGLPMYLRMKELEQPGPRWLYWIEPTLKLYMD